MDAKDHLINAILTESRRYMVPLYQRQYQWGQARLDPFWADVVAKADSILENRPHLAHYMGALILAPGGDGYAIGVTPRMQVVDGQQRLTTFQLLIAAIADVARKLGSTDIVGRASNYLLNATRAADTDPLARYKLSPTPADRSLFHDIVSSTSDQLRSKYSSYYFNNGKLRKGGTPPALAAYEFFLGAIELYLGHGVASAEEFPAAQPDATGTNDVQLARLEALLLGLLNWMKLVVITLDDNDDAQVIFETLNSQGEPLLAMDLVRNNIFHRAESQSESAEALYHTLWGTFDQQWWRDQAPRARPKLPRIDHFLAHVLTAETGQAVSMRELYSEYRGFARPRGQPRFAKVEEELRLLTGYAPAYETLEGRASGHPPVEKLGQWLSAWEMSSAYPVALHVARPDVQEPEREAVARLLYSYIVRRGVCGLSTKSINVAFQRIAGVFKSRGVTAANLLEVVGGQSREAIRFPSDEEFRRALYERPLYQTLGSGRVQDLLWQIELATRTRLTEQLQRPTGLSIEHVLPQRWGTGWPAHDGSPVPHDSTDDRAQNRRRWIDTLGNLTLVTAPLNSSLGNRDFHSKKRMLDEHSLLVMNKAILDRAEWSEPAIAERGKRLAEMALAIWPRA